VKERKCEQKTIVFTVGHVTRSVSEVMEIMGAYGIKKVVDVRTIPKSRHNCQH
jgi:uncharacterized protein (DUF488 family)